MQNTFGILAICIVALSYLHLSSSSVSTDVNDVAFYLYPNANNVSDTDLLVLNDVNTIKGSRYRSDKSTIILIHGFAQNYTLVFPQVVKNAYLAQGTQNTANIIAVDWGKLATPTQAGQPWDQNTLPLNTLLNTVEYFSAVANVDPVAFRVVDFVKFLRANNLLPNLSKVHIIGMSLGAHVAGKVGANFTSDNGGQIGRITGLDPAGPGFQVNAVDERLDPTDATYVDAVHTNAGEFGYAGSLATADYFVNKGGPIQPGCDLLPFNVSQLFCSHGKAIFYYAKSIEDPTLTGCKCFLDNPILFPFLCTSNCKPFGEPSPTDASGNYYLALTTNESW
jgi:pimeloyl-ACP methyl ester carboxylesterase